MIMPVITRCAAAARRPCAAADMLEVTATADVLEATANTVGVSAALLCLRADP
jgi:hypothetical protein